VTAGLSVPPPPAPPQFLGACTKKQPYMIVTEFLPGGSLADLFKAVNKGEREFPSMRRAAAMALDCAKGLTYLHSRSCVAGNPNPKPPLAIVWRATHPPSLPRS
jgi:serine/threonine protein kinase